MAAVLLESITKVYPNGVRAAVDVTVRTAEGELVVLLGPSGCGKTTLLRIIAGLEGPTTGRVIMGSRDVTALPPWQRDVAMVFQRPALYPHKSVRQNLAFGLREKAAARTRVPEVARQLSMEALLDRRPAQLSGGQQQRVALGRALVRRPAVYLLDEPLSHLDTQLRHELRQELHFLQRRLGTTMLYVTHDPVEAMTLADRLVVLDRGVVQQIDSPQAVYVRPRNRFVAGVLGWPPAAFLTGKLHVREGQLVFEGGGLTLLIPESRQAELAPCLEKSLTLGLRPEAVRLDPTAVGVASVPMEVTLVEALGANCLVTLRHNSCRITAWASGRPRVVVGDRVGVEIDMYQALFFDAETGTGVPTG